MKAIRESLLAARDARPAPAALGRMEPFYPLRVWVCGRCFLVQLEEFEPPYPGVVIMHGGAANQEPISSARPIGRTRWASTSRSAIDCAGKSMPNWVSQKSRISALVPYSWPPKLSEGTPSTTRPPQCGVPGGAVAAVLADGDVALDATGTITHRDGGRIYAFGHPFLQQGRVALPMAPAEVVTTLADQTFSYKVSNVGRPVGTVLYDRVTAINGEVGAVPDSPPAANGRRLQAGPLPEDLLMLLSTVLRVSREPSRTGASCATIPIS